MRSVVIIDEANRGREQRRVPVAAVFRFAPAGAPGRREREVVTDSQLIASTVGERVFAALVFVQLARMVVEDDAQHQTAACVSRETPATSRVRGLTIGFIAFVSTSVR